MLAAYASGIHGDGSMISASHVSETPDSVTVKMAAGSAAAAAGARSAVPGPVPASGAGAVSAAVSAPVSAPAGASLSYSRSVVFTGSKEVTRKLDASSSRSPRPAIGTLMSPLEVLHPSSAFGLRKSPITGDAGEFHWGRDFAAACGTRVYSVDAGVVRAVGWHQWGGGNRVEVDHGNGLITTYNHLEGIGVRKGESVQAGDVIAKVGTTGASTGCHLHFETILNGTHTDPEEWTLVPLDPAEPAADVTMTDYRKPGTGTAKDAPAWAVPAAKAHTHEVGHEEHESPPRKAAKAPTRSKAGVSAAASSPAKKAAMPEKSVAPAKPAAPVKTPARAPRPVQPAPVPASSPVKTPVPAPRPEPTPAPSPAKTAAPRPVQPAPVPAPSPVKTAAPKPTVAPKPTSSPDAAPTSAPAAVPVPARNVVQKPSTDPDTAATGAPTAHETAESRTNG